MSAKSDTEAGRGSYFSNSRRNWMALVEEASDDEELITENEMAAAKFTRQIDKAAKTTTDVGRGQPHKDIFRTALRTHCATIGGGALLSEPSGITSVMHPLVSPSAEPSKEDLGCKSPSSATTTAPMFALGKDSSSQKGNSRRGTSQTAPWTHNATMGGGVLLSEGDLLSKSLGTVSTTTTAPMFAFGKANQGSESSSHHSGPGSETSAILSGKPEVEQSEEEVEDLPKAQQQTDFYRNAWVRRGGILGRVAKMEQGKVTKEKLYLIKYDDGEMEHLTRKQMTELTLPGSCCYKEPQPRCSRTKRGTKVHLIQS
jgi:hypothetical protein